MLAVATLLVRAPPSRRAAALCRLLNRPHLPHLKLSWASESQDKGGTGELAQTCFVPEQEGTRFVSVGADSKHLVAPARNGSIPSPIDARRAR